MSDKILKSLSILGLLFGIYFIGSFLFFGCGLLPKDHKEQPTVNPLDALQLKYDKVMEYSKQNLDGAGWPRDVSCDGFTLTAIYVLAGGPSNVYLAEDAKVPGRYYRDALHTCGPANGSSATTQSQDGFVTIATLLWKTKAADRVANIIKYVNGNNGYTGDPHNGTSQMSAPVLNTYSIMSALLQGKTPPSAVGDPNPNAANLVGLKGFQAHLLMWHIYDRGVIYGALNDLEFQTLKQVSGDRPRNTLFSAMTNKFTHGDQSAGIAQLMDEGRFPSDRPCSSDTQCTAYLWSTDDTPKDWAACPDAKQTYTCIDWLIAARVILGDKQGEQ